MWIACTLTPLPNPSKLWQYPSRKLPRSSSPWNWDLSRHTSSAVMPNDCKMLLQAGCILPERKTLAAQSTRKESICSRFVHVYVQSVFTWVFRVFVCFVCIMIHDVHLQLQRFVSQDQGTRTRSGQQCCAGNLSDFGCQGSFQTNEGIAQHSLCLDLVKPS